MFNIKVKFTMVFGSIVFLSLLCFVGCEEGTEKDMTIEEIQVEAENEKQIDNDSSYLTLFYIDNEKTMLVEKQVEYNQAAFTIRTNISTILALLEISPIESDLLPSIPDLVEINKNEYNINEKSIIVDFSPTFYELESNEALLLRASLVLSLAQLDYVDAVKITVDGQPLLDSNGQPIGFFTAADIVVAGYDYLLNSKTYTINLYFSNKEGTSLLMEQRIVQLETGQTLPQVVLMELMEGPKGSAMQQTIPDNTKVIDIIESGGICYVDLSKDFVQGQLISKINDELIIYSIVNSLTDLNSINQVQFYIEGSNEKFKKPLSRNLDIIEN